jgi:hypothetical protein
MNWLKDYSYLSGWLALPIAVVAMIFQNKGKPLKDIDWSRPLIYLALLTALAVAFNANFDTQARISAQMILFYCLVFVGMDKKPRT